MLSLTCFCGASIQGQYNEVDCDNGVNDWPPKPHFDGTVHEGAFPPQVQQGHNCQSNGQPCCKADVVDQGIYVRRGEVQKGQETL